MSVYTYIYIYTLPCTPGDGILWTRRLARAKTLVAAVAFLAASCPVTAAPQVPLPGPGLLRTPRFAGQRSAAPRPPQRSSSRGSPRGVSGTRSAAPVFSDWFFSCLLKGKLRRGKGCKARLLFGSDLGRCLQLLFPGGWEGGRIYL